jgi:hypothetical protein
LQILKYFFGGGYFKVPAPLDYVSTLNAVNVWKLVGLLIGFNFVTRQLMKRVLASHNKVDEGAEAEQVILRNGLAAPIEVRVQEAFIGAR